MAASQNLTFDYWLCYGGSGSGYWQVGYQGSASVSVSRASGSTTANVSINASIYTQGGDTASWTLYVQVGSNTAVSASFGGGTYHAPASTYYATKSIDVAVGDSAGSLKVTAWVKINAAGAAGGTSSPVKTTNALDYDSRGGGIITSCSDLTIGNKVNINWTAYSTDMYYWFKFECGSFSAWSNKITVSSTGTQTFTNYTVPTNIANSISSQSTNADVTVSLITYSDSGGTTEIGRSAVVVKVYTTKAQAATIQSNWTLKETNTSNPFKTSVKDIGGDGTYRFVKNISSLKLTVYAYSAYGAIPTTLYGGFNALTFTEASFNKTSNKDSSGNYDLYKAELTFTPDNDGSAHWWWFYVRDSRGYSTPMIADSTGIFTVKTDSSGNIYMLLNVADYDEPQIIDLKLNISDTSISIIPTTKVYSVLATNGTTQLNTIKTYKLTRTKLSSSASTNIVNDTSKCSYGTVSPTYSDTLADVDTESYSYTLTIQDQMGSVTKSTLTAIIALSFYKGGKGASFFREANESDEGYISMWGNGFYVHNTDTTTGGGISLEMSDKGNKGLYAWGGGDWDEQWLAYYSQTSGMFQIPNWKNIGYEANTEPMYPVVFSEIGAPQVVRPIQKSTYAFGSDTTGYVWFCVYGHVVNFYGTIKGMTASAASHTCAFTLPEELRPWMSYQIFPAYNRAAPYAANWYSSCWISKAGKMIIYKNSAQSVTDVYVCGTFISLDSTAATNSSLLMDSPEDDLELS